MWRQASRLNTNSFAQRTQLPPEHRIMIALPSYQMACYSKLLEAPQMLPTVQRDGTDQGPKNNLSDTPSETSGPVLPSVNLAPHSYSPQIQKAENSKENEVNLEEEKDGIDSNTIQHRVPIVRNQLSINEERAIQTEAGVKSEPNEAPAASVTDTSTERLLNFYSFVKGKISQAEPSKQNQACLLSGIMLEEQRRKLKPWSGVSTSQIQNELLFRILSLQNLIVEEKSEQSLESIFEQRRNQIHQTRDLLKIEKTHIDMAEFLASIPDESEIAIQASERGLRHNGEQFKSSDFRGVCKNGKKFQMFIMGDGRNKKYVGGFETQLEAAKAYDKAAMQMKGSKARTNFSYTKSEVVEVMKSAPVVRGTAWPDTKGLF